MHALHRLEDRLHPPEAAAGEHGDLLVLAAGDVLRGRRDRHRALGGGGGDRRQQQCRSGEASGKGPFQHGRKIVRSVPQRKAAQAVWMRVHASVSNASDVA